MNRQKPVSSINGKQGVGVENLTLVRKHHGSISPFNSEHFYFISFG